MAEGAGVDARSVHGPHRSGLQTGPLDSSGCTLPFWAVLSLNRPRNDDH